jgi:hypothetical protein
MAGLLGFVAVRRSTILFPRWLMMSLNPLVKSVFLLGLPYYVFYLTWSYTQTRSSAEATSFPFLFLLISPLTAALNDDHSVEFRTIVSFLLILVSVFVFLCNTTPM